MSQTPTADGGLSSAIEGYFKSNPTAIDPKFNGDASAAAASYMELQKKFTQVSQELAGLKKTEQPTPPPQAPDTAKPDEPPVTADPSLKIPPPPKEPDPVSAAEQAWTKATAEFAQDGNVSKETRELLKKAHNADDAIVDAMIEGQRAKASAQAAEAANILGGADKLKSLVDWISKNKPVSEHTRIQQQLSTANPDWQAYLIGLNAQYQKSIETSREPGRTPATVAPGSSPTATGAFRNLAEQTNAMRAVDASGRNRYKTDPSYRDEVARRIQATAKHGWAG